MTEKLSESVHVVLQQMNKRKLLNIDGPIKLRLQKMRTKPKFLFINNAIVPYFSLELPEKPKLSMEQPENRSLMQIVRSQAQNDSDKHDILAARDKLMREKAPPKDGATILKGCCPDICPEKERYVLQQD